MFVLNSVMSCIRSKKICKLNKLLNKSDTSRLVAMGILDHALVTVIVIVTSTNRYSNFKLNLLS